MQFASVEQYRAIYDTSISDERIDVFLQKATRRIAAALDGAGISYDEPSQDFSDTLADVCCDVVHRALGSTDSNEAQMPFGATQYSQGANGYSESFTLSNPYGDLFLTQAERDLLGINSQVITSITPLLECDRVIESESESNTDEG